MTTSKKAASAAGRTLAEDGEHKLEITAEASALAQAKKGFSQEQESKASA